MVGYANTNLVLQKLSTKRGGGIKFQFLKLYFFESDTLWPYYFSGV